MGGLLEGLGSSIGGLFGNSMGRVADAVNGAVAQVTSLVPADPRVAVVGVLAAVAVLWWLLRR